MSPAAPIRRSVLVRVYLGLLGLLALTAISARLVAGPWSLPLGMAVAAAKLVLIFLFFMGLRTHRGMIRIFAAAGFFWLGIAWLLTFSDYLTRTWTF